MRAILYLRNIYNPNQRRYVHPTVAEQEAWIMAKLATYPGEWTVVGRYVENEDWGREEKGTRGTRGWRYEDGESDEYAADTSQSGLLLNPLHGHNIRKISFGSRHARQALLGACLQATGQSEETEDDAAYTDVSDVVVFLAHMPKLWAYRWIVEFISDFPNERSEAPIRWMKVYPPQAEVPMNIQLHRRRYFFTNQFSERLFAKISTECSEYISAARRHRKLLHFNFMSEPDCLTFFLPITKKLYVANDHIRASKLAWKNNTTLAEFILFPTNGFSFRWERNPRAALSFISHQSEFNRYWDDNKSEWARDLVCGDLDGWIASGNVGEIFYSPIWGVRRPSGVRKQSGYKTLLERLLGFKLERSHMTHSWIDYY